MLNQHDLDSIQVLVVHGICGLLSGYKYSEKLNNSQLIAKKSNTWAKEKGPSLQSFLQQILVLDYLEFLEHVGSLLGEQEFVGFIHDIVVA